ncbi:S41 family peptidase [Marinilabiliaceae bacterium JC017]|nr:S41 family peptidase [Marinilabiliaceae bacterium JC017]
MTANKSRRIYLPVVFALLLVFGIYIGRTFFTPGSVSKHNPLLIYPQTNKIEALLNLIEEEYVDTINKTELEEKVIPEILKNLDPHTVYIPAKNLAEVNEELEGNFGGIGVQFSLQDDTVMVVAVVSGGPSEKVGILPGDRIIAVDDSIIAGVKISTTNVMKKLRGEIGTKVKVGVHRRDAGKQLDFEIVRGPIPIHSVDVAYMIDEKTGYIKIDRFAQNTYQEFLTSLAKLKANNCQQVVIDLRGNSGGLLDVAFRLTNEFLKKNEMIFYTQGKSQPRQDVYANGAGTCQDNKVVVLIDEFSASASEIFSGAIQDNDRGIIVGRRSFGKGLVQSQIPLPDGSAIRLTVARYYTPSGRSIQKPYENGNTSEYYQDIYNRFEHGEFFEKDSIKFDDELQYKTKSGRVVYGGGGIMPDVFVPRDTTLFSDYYWTLQSKGTTYRFALQYADNNREAIQGFNDVKSLKAYLDKQPILREFLAFAKKEGIKYKAKQFKQSRKIIDIQLKAYIARNIMDNDGFYPIFHEMDQVLKRAVEELNKQ